MSLSTEQTQQIQLTRQEATHVDHAAIADELNQLKVPLYFLDYETFNFAVPPLDGFKPFQQFVFQYSLHVLRSADPAALDALEHHEFLADSLSQDSLLHLVDSLREAIHSDNGSVVVWHRSFEETRNRELGELIPNAREFFSDLNRRVFDLEDIFRKRQYVDYRFKGRTSIKAVLPVLCPEFDYGTLEIQNGSAAMEAWHGLVHGEYQGDVSTVERIRSSLLAYCELDTLAMVRIYAKLNDTLGAS